jgi:hypothetical protein
MKINHTKHTLNSYGSRRGNDEVIPRGTFANIRLVNMLLNGEVGPKTIHIPTGEKLYVFDAAMVSPMTSKFLQFFFLYSIKFIITAPMRYTYVLGFPFWCLIQFSP